MHNENRIALPHPRIFDAAERRFHHLAAAGQARAGPGQIVPEDRIDDASSGREDRKPNKHKCPWLHLSEPLALRHSLLASAILGGVAGQPVGPLQKRWDAVLTVHAGYQRRRFRRLHARRRHEQRTLALAAKHGR